MTFDLPGRDDEKKNRYQLVYNYLSDPLKGSWLMIIDNADDDGTFFDQRPIAGGTHARLFDYIPQRSHGKVLITTRDRRLGKKLSLDRDTIKVPQLDQPKARAMMEARLHKRVVDDDYVDKLLEALDYLPLAIAQAAAYARYNEISLVEYYEELCRGDHMMSKILQKDHDDPRRDRDSTNSVFRTLAISFQRIQITQKRAADMLSLMSVLDRQGIHQDLVQNKDEDWDVVTESLGTLKAYSLITTESNTKTFTMHRLVQMSIHIWLDHQNTVSVWQTSAVTLLSSRVPSGEYENWELWGRLSPHARKVIEYECGTEEEMLERALILNNLAWYELRLGRYKQAQEKGQLAEKIRESFLADDDDQVIFTKSLLALALGYQGLMTDAIPLQKSVLESRTKKLGESHRKTLDSFNNLAWMYSKLGQWSDIETIYQHVLENRMKNPELGPNHRQTITARSNYAGALFRTHKVEKAVDYGKQAYKEALSCEDLGERHPDTLEVLDTYAEALRAAKDLNLAEEMSRKALTGHMNGAEGAGHPASLLSMIGLIQVLTLQDKQQEASEMFERVLSLCKEQEIIDKIEYPNADELKATLLKMHKS